MAAAVCVIINPKAGGGRALRLLPSVLDALRVEGRTVRVERTRSLEHARELARACADAGELPAVLGGDGSIGAVAGALRDRDTPLLALPGGRGNDFARKLGIGSDPVAAARLLDHGRIRAVDTAEADGAPFLGIASVGIDSDVQAIAARTRLPLGGQVYAYGALRALARWRPARFTVSVDGEAHSFDGYSVAACNSGVFGGGMQLVPDADLGDGLLDVACVGDASKLRYAAGLRRVFKGTHVQLPHFRRLRGREIRLAADRPFTVYADGDPIAELPTTITVDPGALRVYVNG